MANTQKKDNITNGEDFGFSKDADFIPFDFDQYDDHEDNERQTSITINGHGRKRKRDDFNSSPEQEHDLPPQKRAEVNVHPWQRNLDEYISCTETAIMYKLSTAWS